MGRAHLNRHLSIMALINNPSCNQCSMAIDSISHFLCQCDTFITLRRKVWGKSYDTDHAKKSSRFTQKQYGELLMGPISGLSLRGSYICRPTLELEQAGFSEGLRSQRLLECSCKLQEEEILLLWLAWTRWTAKVKPVNGPWFSYLNNVFK